MVRKLGDETKRILVPCFSREFRDWNWLLPSWSVAEAYLLAFVPFNGVELSTTWNTSQRHLPSKEHVCRYHDLLMEFEKEKGSYFQRGFLTVTWYPWSTHACLWDLNSKLGPLQELKIVYNINTSVVGYNPRLQDNVLKNLDFTACVCLHGACRQLHHSCKWYRITQDTNDPLWVYMASSKGRNTK